MEKKTLFELVGACSLIAVLLALLMYFFRKTYTVSN